MDLREVRRASAGYTDVTCYSCLNLQCTYLEHVQYYHLLHKMDITCHYATLLAITMDLREVCRASTGYTDTHFAMQNIVITMHVLTWYMQSVITYYTK